MLVSSQQGSQCNTLRKTGLSFCPYILTILVRGEQQSLGPMRLQRPKPKGSQTLLKAVTQRVEALSSQTGQVPLF
jgi:hypothetical protein